MAEPTDDIMPYFDYLHPPEQSRCTPAAGRARDRLLTTAEIQALYAYKK